MRVNRAKVLLGLLVSRCAEPFVVLDFEGFHVLALRPRLILWYREECRHIFGALAYLDDWSDELFKEPINFQETRPEVMNEVDDQTLDVGAIVILIRHNHDRAIAQ